MVVWGATVDSTLRGRVCCIVVLTDVTLLQNHIAHVYLCSLSLVMSQFNNLSSIKETFHRYLAFSVFLWSNPYYLHVVFRTTVEYVSFGKKAVLISTKNLKIVLFQTAYKIVVKIFKQLSIVKYKKCVTQHLGFYVNSMLVRKKRRV